jgi:NADH-quinone oxidoreductase subunit J
VSHASLTDAGVATGGEAFLFWVLAIVIVVAALGLLFARKAVHAAMSMVVVMVGLAFLYVAQDAPFLGVVQVVVYTGAIMMLFLFVLMLVGVDASDTLTETLRGQRWLGAIAGLGLLVVLVGVVGRAHYGPATGLTAANADSNPVALARLVFGSYAFAFEVVGALLITAAVGAIMLTHRRRLTPRVTQKERAEARVKAGTLRAQPAPGVYARHNAMDVPALGPDGQPIEQSVSRVLRVRGQEADAQEYAARIDRVLSGDWATAPTAPSLVTSETSGALAPEVSDVTEAEAEGEGQGGAGVEDEPAAAGAKGEQK